MTERLIVFSEPMVRAPLAGRKSQNRRSVKVPGVLDGRHPALPLDQAIELGDDRFARGE